MKKINTILYVNIEVNTSIKNEFKHLLEIVAFSYALTEKDIWILNISNYFWFMFNYTIGYIIYSC